MQSTVMPHATDRAADQTSPPIRVVSIPAAHPYVGRVTASPDIDVLSDPPVEGAPAGVWWPPAALDPSWIRDHAADADVLHIHFGTESFPPGHVTACIEAAHQVGWSVVYTVHDLEHPQLDNQAAYDRQLDELVRGADALITLTPGAAAGIRERWGRDAVVIPHPSLLSDDVTVPLVLPSSESRVGVHLKDLRPNVDAIGAVTTLVDAVERLRRHGRDVVAEVRMHHAVRDPDVREVVRRIVGGSDAALLIEHERLDDAGLAIALSRLDVCLLPYRHGTHSGWLELCWDLGVSVAAPAGVGQYVGQHPDSTVAGYAPGDGDSLEQAIRALLEADGATRPGSSDRIVAVAGRRARRVVDDAAGAAAHAELYRRVTAERAS
ncbi:glycosyltransferase [Plantibacter sp. ME-Dv--P-122b]|uniref:glycosyltransferase n=1 Tax=Plantibacter sp. ME-Dv--P-122b TaxID=3040300 RepID=UPI00254D642C|nr:glycosyltransferase [Plantibacter sp. ME-Dv--P-122b]